MCNFFQKTDSSQPLKMTAFPRYNILMNKQKIEDWYIGFVPGTLNPMNLVRIQNPQPFLKKLHEYY